MKTKKQSPMKMPVLLFSAWAAVSTAQASGDYGPAIWRPTCNANWYTTGSGHKFHVCHDMEGYYASTISLFTSCGYTSASVHYAINGKQDTSSDYPAGEITQMIAEANYAWHVRCWNQYCTGTEHEGFASNPAWYSEAMYQASAALSRHAADKFGYAKDRNHIVGHNEWQNAGWRSYAGPAFGIDTTCNTHTDPGAYWDWSHYMALVNPPSGPLMSPTPAVAVNSDGRLETFAISSSNASVWEDWQTAVNGPWYSGTDQNALGGDSNTAIAASRNADGRLSCFVLGYGSSVYYKSQMFGGGWDNWTSLSGDSNTALAVATNLDGRMEVFVLGNGSSVYHKSQVSPSSSTWSSVWDNLSGDSNTALSVAQNADGRLEVFVLGHGSSVYYKSQVAPNSSTWTSSWGTLSGDSNTAMVVAKNADGRLQVFVLGNGSAVYTKWQTAPNSDSWTPNWTSLGGDSNTALAVAQNADGRLQVFVLGNGSAVYTKWQTAANSNTWSSSWTSLSGDSNTGLATGRDADGRLEVFVIGSQKHMYRKAQSSAGSGTWDANWQNLGGTLE